MNTKKTPTKSQKLAQKMREYREVLRDDEDWDWHHVLVLLAYKLSRTRECIAANRIIADWRVVRDQIAEVERLIGRVLADRYLDEISVEFTKKYGQLKMVFGEKEKSGTPVTFTYTRVRPADLSKANREWRRLRLRAEKMLAADLDRAMHLMAKNLRNWWD